MANTGISRFRLLVENFVTYGLGGVIGKIIPVIMLPIITRMMPSTTYYGINDLANVIISFATAIAVFGMYDAMFRFFFDDKNVDYQKKVCSTAFGFTLMMSVVVFILLILFRTLIAKVVFHTIEYEYVVVITAFAVLAGGTNTIVSAPTRMQNKRKIYLATNILSPIISYVVVFILLLYKKYIIAMPIGGLISAVFTELVFWKINCNWFNVRLFDFTILKKMLTYAIPCVPIISFYWIFNSSDRLMIGYLLNTDAVGIYAVSSKVGMISQLIYTAFSSGWAYFTFSTMDDKQHIQINSIIFEYMTVISLVTTSFICSISYILYKALFPASYLSGYMVAPYLYLSPLLLMLYQIMSSQFAVEKKMWSNLIILGIGVVVNLILNYLLIPLLEIEGAALATVAGYVSIVAICYLIMKRINLIVLSRRYGMVIVAMVIYFILWRLFLLESVYLGMALFVLFTLFCCAIYRDGVKLIRQKIICFFNKRGE